MEVDTLYRCHCGKTEEYRAKNNIPQFAHYCRSCFDKLNFDIAINCEPVFQKDDCSETGHSLGGGCEKCVIGYYDSPSSED